MILTETNASILERPYSIQHLLLLRKNFPMPLVELQRQMKVNRSTLERRIEDWSSAGVVKYPAVEENEIQGHGIAHTFRP